MPARDLSQFKVKTPCSADWNSMTGNDTVRLCDHCQLNVHYISQLTPKQLRALVLRSKGKLCVRYLHGGDGTPLLGGPKRLHQIQRCRSRVAAGLFSATLTFSQTPTHDLMRQPSPAEYGSGQVDGRLMPLDFEARILGRVTSNEGAPIEGAGVLLQTMDDQVLTGTITNAAGEFSFEGLPGGQYWLTFQAWGYQSTGRQFANLFENSSVTIDKTLYKASDSDEEPRQYATAGAIAVTLEIAEPLIQAAYDDDLQTLGSLLTRENVNTRDTKLGRTALECAVSNGDREMVQLLLQSGADVNTRNSSKETPLMMVGSEAPSDIVWDLVHAGAKVDSKDDDGETALMSAAQQANLPVLNALLHAGAKVDIRNDEGQTALMLAVQNDQMANIKTLIRAGADLNAHDNDGWTPLDYAFSSDNARMIRLLLSFGAIRGKREENRRSKSGGTEDG